MQPKSTDTWRLRVQRRHVFQGNGDTVVQSIPFESLTGIRQARPASPLRSAADRTPVSDAMTADVLCVRETVSIEALSALFLTRGISGAPVVDERGRAIGVVSKTDLVREQYENGQALFDPAASELTARALGDDLQVTEMTRGTVADVMTPVALTLYAHSPLSRAAALMACERMHRIPVVSEEGKVVGILTAMDVMRWLAEQDGYVVERRPIVEASR